MLLNSILASTAIFAAFATAQAPGTASVINKCPFPVYLANTPSADGVHQTESATLATGQSYSQTYTKLNNLMGWSLKLAQSDTFPNDATFQFEYTFLDDGTIWFDLSNVNNQLWSLLFDISSSDPSCDSTMQQVAYLFPTDDTAMQRNCSQSADVTVALCSAPGTASTSSWSSPLTSLIPASSSPQASSSSPATSLSSPAPVTPASPAAPVGYTSAAHNGPIIPAFSVPVQHNAELNSPATSTSSALAAVVDGNGFVDTVWVTDVVIEHVTLTTTADTQATPVVKRHEHHAHAHAHAHGH